MSKECISNKELRLYFFSGNFAGDEVRQWKETGNCLAEKEIRNAKNRFDVSG
jgi:hypothetical protein